MRYALLWSKCYGSRRGTSAQYYEAFEICEYGTQPDDADMRKLFPFFVNNSAQCAWAGGVGNGS